MYNAKNVEKEDTGMLIVGKIKGKRRTTTLTESLWDPHSVDKLNKMTRKKIENNGRETELCHHR